MKKQTILNPTIEKILRKKQNFNLFTKLKTMKPQVDIQCPESFLFFKTSFHSYKTQSSVGKKYDTIQNNNNKTNKKLVNIRQISCNRKLKKIKVPYFLHLNTSGSNSLKKNNYNVLKTNFIPGKSFIDTSPLGYNFDLKKRINEKNSVYSLSQWKKDFKRSRIYKKISCEYPSINFVGKKKKIITQNYVFSPKKDYNIFNGIRFKPFESFEEENSKGEKSNNKNKKRRRKLMLLYK